MSKIHKFMLEDTRILLDVNSGSIHLIDQATWDYLDRLKDGQDSKQAQATLLAKYEPEQIEEVVAEVEELIQQKLLFTDDETGQSYQGAEKPLVKALCLHISHDCNLNCVYCFAGAGHFGGERQHMSLDVGKAAIDFLLEASGTRKNCEIDFFGGEPLLNFSVVKELVGYGKEKAALVGKTIKFTLTTNGLLLNREVEEFLNEQQMSVVLSIDGRPEINDLMRPTLKGQGTYGVILENYRRFCASREHKNYFLRGTFTGHNLDFSQDVIHLADEGFPLLSVEPVVAPEGESYAFREEDLPQLFSEYEKLTREYLSRWEKDQGFEFFHFNLDLNRGPCLPKRLSGCGAGHEYLAVTPEGELFPCHQFVGNSQFSLGNLKQGVINPQLSKEFQLAHVYSKPQCLECWARFYCSGGCHANNYHAHGSLHQVYEIGCQLAKKRIECAIYIEVKKALAEQK